jgi:DNA-binding transcriptional LysR family regulator
MLDPRRLLTFRAVARAGSFSAAARELSLTQPAVSQQVAALERELGARLLHRAPGGPTLTAAGELALEHADALADRIALADSQLAELADDGVAIRVGGFPSALATIVPAAVERLVPRRVEAVEGTGEELAAAVRDGGLHLAIVFQDAAAPRREHPGLRRHDLVDEPFIALVGPGHRLAERSTVRLSDLAGDPWTMPSQSGILHEACVAAGFEADVRFITRDVLAIRALVAADLAVTLAPRLLAGQLPGVHTLTLRTDAPRRTVYALTPRTGTTAAARAFLDAVRESL